MSDRYVVTTELYKVCFCYQGVIERERERERERKMSATKGMRLRVCLALARTKPLVESIV